MGTFLTLSSGTRRECGVPGTGPAAVTGQTGALERIVNWVAQAWTEIQQKHPNWRWMRKPFTVNTVSGTDTYAYGSVTDSEAAAVITRFARWLPDDDNHPFQCYLTSGGVGGEYRLIYLPYDQFQWQYKLGTQNNGQPIHVSVDHNDKIVLGPKPNAIYTVTGEFQRSAQIFAANGDTPEMPAQFHNLIMYMAMCKHAGFESAPEVLLRGTTEGNRMMRALERSQLPALQLAGPLA